MFFRIGIAAFVLSTALLVPPVQSDEGYVDRLVDDLHLHGKPPLEFVVSAMDRHVLLIFDDALHNAVEPWDFYGELVREPGFTMSARHIFIEIVAVNDQTDLDAYFETYPEDPALVLPALQNAHIRGWRYQTYADLFRTIHGVNAGLPEDRRIRVHGVSTPAYWREMDTPADFANHNEQAQLGRDNLMYSIIKSTLNELDGSERGIFLTNTRHAYTGLRNSDGGFFWNTATFFRQWHDEAATLSIRFNAPFLNVRRTIEKPEGPSTGQGLEKLSHDWIRAAGGDWDRAFEKTNHSPVAIPLAESAFGEAPYIGSRMHRAQSGQTMADVNDVLIHLSRLESWQKSAVHGAMYTPAFRAEVVRRYQTAYRPEEIARLLERSHVDSLAAYVDLVAEAAPRAGLRQARELEPLE